MNEPRDKPSPLVERAVQRLRDNIARREATEDVEALKTVLLELDRLRSSARSAIDSTELARLREIEHVAWHLLDDAEENAQTGDITLFRGSGDYEKLCALLPEDHPSAVTEIAAIDGWVEVFANRHINVRLPTIFINHCDDMNSDRTEK